MNDWLPPLDYDLSPHTGYTRAHWQAVLARLTYGYVLAAERQGSPARALFPGDFCDRPDAVDGLEAAARIGVAWGAWLHNPANSDCLEFSGRELNLVALLRQALLEGTDPHNPDTYWGDIGHMDQRIVEASGIALTLWLSRKRVFESFTTNEQSQVIDWLAQVDGKETWPDNWIFFPALVQTVRLHLGYPISESDLDRRLEQMAAFYRGDGWYADGAGAEFDLYNSWMFGCHYLFWAWIDGDRRPDHRQRLVQRARSFLDGFQYFFGANGSYAAWGRSLLGRFVATVCFQLGHCLNIAPPTPGRLRRIASGCLRYFVDHDLFDPAEHFARQGFHGHSPQAGESYVAPASPLSACHALFALAFDQADPFWTEPELPLPVECEDFDLAFPVSGLAVSGRRATGQVLLLNSRSGHPADVPRPGYVPKYGKFTYSSHFPFNVAPVAESYAPDAMIALTQDGRAFGHRDTTQAGQVAPGFGSCDFYETVAGQPQRLRVSVLLWGDVQVRVAWIHPTLPVQAFEAPGTLGCQGAAQVIRRSNVESGWEYAEADNRAVAIQRLLGYDSQKTSGPFLGHSNLNLAYPYAEQPLVYERYASAEPRLLGALSLIRPRPFEPDSEFANIRATLLPQRCVRIDFADQEEVLVALGDQPITTLQVNDLIVEGDDLRMVRSNQTATQLVGVGLRSIANVATLCQPGTVLLNKQSETVTRLVTDTGLTLANEWLGGSIGRVTVSTLNDEWCDVTAECPQGVISNELVHKWSDLTQRTLVEFRVMASN